MKWLTAPTPVAHALLIWSLGMLGGLIGVPLGVLSSRLRPGELRRRHRH